jgi:putative oxidoreductase
MSNQTYAASGVVPSAVPSAITTIVPAVGRVLISSIFLLSGLSKLAAPAMTIGYIQSVGLPLPPVAFGLAVFIEIVGGTTLLLGYRTRIAAGVLFLFALATAVFFHANFGDQNQFIHFFKNIAIAGGLFQVATFGAGSISIDGLRTKAYRRGRALSPA